MCQVLWLQQQQVGAVVGPVLAPPLATPPLLQDEPLLVSNRLGQQRLPQRQQPLDLVTLQQQQQQQWLVVMVTAGSPVQQEHQHTRHFGIIGTISSCIGASCGSHQSLCDS